MRKEILLVEDDRALGRGVALALQSDELSVKQMRTLSAARTALIGWQPDLLILDVNLPDGNGLALLREVKQQFGFPVILLTANDLETDVVAGLAEGADDYITKPFSLAILRARVQVQLRRLENLARESVRLGVFSFDFGDMIFKKNGGAVELSKTEQKLLRLLVENRGRTLPRALLVDKIWTDGAEYVEENALSVTVKRLRDKLEDDPSHPRYIKTVYGIGYRWTETETPTE